MKKLWIVMITAAFLLAGCTSKKKTDPDVTPDPRESASISEIDFTQADAERLVQKAVKEHCGQVACEVTSVRIQGGNITAVYTYTLENDEKSAEAVLYDVSVDPNNKTVYTASREEYKDSIPAIDDGSEQGKPEETDSPEETDQPEKTDDPSKDDKKHEKGNYDLPDHVDESDENIRNDEKVFDESGVQIWRIYTNKGRIEFTGTYSGDSKFLIQIMDLSQNVLGEPVNMKEAGDIDAAMKLEEGFYYVRIEAAGGWSLYWNRIYE